MIKNQRNLTLIREDLLKKKWLINFVSLIGFALILAGQVPTKVAAEGPGSVPGRVFTHNGGFSAYLSKVTPIYTPKTILENNNLNERTAPGSFSKNSPSDGATNVSNEPTLAWESSSDADTYEYCIDTTTDNNCDNWISNGTATEVTPSGLGSGTTYYWQVRAINTDETTEANGGSWWHFTTVFPPPPSDTYSKQSPFIGAEDLVPSSITLEWGISGGAQSYEYCIDTTNDDTCSDWVSTGTAVEVNPPGLSLCNTYYWQVRARNIGGTTEPDQGYWYFSTLFIPEPSEYYSKISPSIGTEDLDPSSITLKWHSTQGGESYEYCIDTTDDDTCLADEWISTGTALEVTLTGLSMGTTYHWQVRARNACGTTEPEGSWWWFTTTPDAPAAFSKTAPENEDPHVALSPTLTWETNSDADSYEYCLGSSADVCNLVDWTDVGTDNSVALSGLTTDTTYFWQVRAVNPSGTTYGNDGAWWSFTTVPDPPATFSKSTPTDEETEVALPPTLKWGASSGAASYEYCIDTSNDNNCSDWISTGLDTQVTLNRLLYGTTYYWQVRATNVTDTIEANEGHNWRFTTISSDVYLPLFIKE